MEEKNLESIIEGILFAMGDSVEPAKMAEALEVSEDEVTAVLEELSEELGSKASFYAMDVDDNQGIAMRFSISSIPYVAVFRDGVRVDEQIGFVPKDQLKAFVASAL